MSNDNVKTMVDSLADGDNVAAQDAFKSALSDKIGSALDDKRMTVANDWLNAAHETEDGLWRCETIFEGLGGERPRTRDGAFECPKERTRCELCFDPTTGTLAPSAAVLISQAGCIV